MNILPCLKMFDEVFKGYNAVRLPYKDFKTISRSLKEKGQQLLDLRIDFLKEKNENNFTYKNKERKIYEITLNPLHCNCISFLENKICKHLSLVSLYKEYDLPGIEHSKRGWKFVRRNTQRKSKKLKASQCLNMSE